MQGIIGGFAALYASADFELILYSPCYDEDFVKVEMEDITQPQEYIIGTPR